jgi:hypothetical protein
VPMIRSLTKRGLFNPVARAAIISWAWGYRHEFLRWGRSLWNDLITRKDLDPNRALRTARVLVSIASEERLRNASELKQVTITDGVVDLRVKSGWRDLPLLVDRVRAVKGVQGVTVNGTEVATVSSR